MHTRKKPSLLMLSHRVPFPVHNGQSARTFNILKQLATRFDITLLCFDNRDKSRPEMAMQERLAAVNPYVREVHVFRIPQELSIARFARDHLVSVATAAPYTFPMYRSQEFSQQLGRELESHPFDIVHLESGDLLDYARSIVSTPVVCTHHNVESALLRRRALAERNLFIRTYMRHQAALLERAERRLLGAVALNIVVSEDDRQAIVSLAPAARVTAVPNGVDVEHFDPSKFARERAGAAFLGGTNWFPNRDALGWYSAEIAPALSDGGVHTKWAGYSSEQERQQFQLHGVELTGFLRDPRDLLAATRAFVVPLRVGGGTRLKILEAWAMEAPVVSTSIGCEGLDARHGDNILIADTSRAFADAVLRLHQDDELARRIGAAGRRTVEERYSWASLGDRLCGAYMSLVADRRNDGDNP